MGCGSNNNSCYKKSCQRYFNNNAQAFVSGTNTTLTIAGTRVVNSGISINTQPQSYEIVKPGLYHISADAVIEGSAAGAATISAYLDGVQMPCTIKTVTLEADSYTDVHTETDVAFASCCCNISHTITFVISSTGAGSVTNFCSGILKEA